MFELHYLGSVEYSFGLNFSRPAAPMIGQMFIFIQLGQEGFRAVMEADLKNARLLSRALEYSGLFTVVSECHHPATKKVEHTTEASKYKPSLPVVSFHWTDELRREYPRMEQAKLQTLLRSKGWIVPNYELPPRLETVQILRVVVRESVTENMVDTLVKDIIGFTRVLIEDQRKIQKAIDKIVTSGDESAHTKLEHRRERHRRIHRRNEESLRTAPHGHGRRGKGFSSQC